MRHVNDKTIEWVQYLQTIIINSSSYNESEWDNNFRGCFLIFFSSFFKLAFIFASIILMISGMNGGDI